MLSSAVMERKQATAWMSQQSDDSTSLKVHRDLVADNFAVHVFRNGRCTSAVENIVISSVASYSRNEFHGDTEELRYAGQKCAIAWTRRIPISETRSTIFLRRGYELVVSIVETNLLVGSKIRTENTSDGYRYEWEENPDTGWNNDDTERIDMTRHWGRYLTERRKAPSLLIAFQKDSGVSIK